MANRNIQPLQFKTIGLPPGLNIRYRPDSDNPIRSGEVKTGQSETTHDIGPSTPIYTNQMHYDPKQVQKYRKSGSNFSTENNTERPLMHEAGGNLWHYDGLHRAIAARLNHKQFKADINWSDDAW